MEAVFMHLLDIGITAGFVVLGVLLLRLLFKKAPKWIAVLLWALVAVRLMLPFSFESVLSIVPDIDVPTAPAADSVSAGNMTVTHPWAGQEIDVTPQYDEVVDDFGFGGDAALVPAGDVDTDSGLSVTPAQLATAVWLVGVVGMTVYAAVSYLLLYRRVRTATHLRDNIYQSEAVGSPFVLGILRPRIYLPYTLDDAHLDSVLAHERAHIKRGDHIIKPLGFLLLTIYWFQPLLWVAYVLLCRDIEMACDERAIKTLSEEERRGYSMALLTSAVGRRRIAACPLAFGEVAVSSRVKGVMSYKKPAFWIVIVAVIVGLVAGAMLLTDRPAPKTYGEPQMTLEGAEVSVVRLDSSHSQTFELEPKADGTYRHRKIIDGTPEHIWFWIGEVDEENMSVTMCVDKPMMLDGKEVNEAVVPYNGYVLLTQEVGGKTQRYIMRLIVPTAIDNEPHYKGDEQQGRVVQCYVGDGYTLMLYTEYFKLVKGDILSYNPEESLEHDKIVIEELSTTESMRYLYDNDGAVYVENQAVGSYEFTDDGRLVLTEDGGVSRYVFEVSEDGSKLSHLKDEFARYKSAVSPILKNETLTREYICRIDALTDDMCDYAVFNGADEEVYSSHSVTEDLTLTMLEKGTLRVEEHKGTSEGHLSTISHLELDDRRSDTVASLFSRNKEYVLFAVEEDGKVFVDADLSYPLWCGTPPVPQTLHIELEGASSITDAHIIGEMDDDDLVVTYLDADGEEYIIARRLEGEVMWDDDCQGETLTRPLIVIERVGDAYADYSYDEDDRTLTYQGVDCVYIRIGGKYHDLQDLLENGEMTISQFEEFVKTDVEKNKAEIVATYRDGGTWVAKYHDADDAHTITFRHTVAGDNDVVIGADVG